jgi:hypothetical protein
MPKPHKVFFGVGIFFIAGGALSAAGGGMAMYRFLETAKGQTDFTVGQLAKGLIGPHIFMLFGVGVAVYGIILIARGFIFTLRMRSYGPGEK